MQGVGVRMIPGRRRTSLVVFVAAVTLAVVLVPFGARVSASVPAAHSTFSAAILSGDYVSFKCPHSEILLATDIVCHDQSSVQSVLPADGHDYSVTMTATIDSGWSTLNGWLSSGDACLGGTVGGTCHNTSSANPLTLWEYCANGGHCTGSVTLSVGNMTTTVLAGENSSPNSASWSVTLNFSVPSGEQHEIVFWAIGATAAVTLTLPAGITIKTQFGNSTGVGFGSLAAGNYSITASSNGATVYAQSIAVVGVVNDTAFSYEFKSISQQQTLSLTSGAQRYLGALSTGGASITNASLTTIIEEASANSGGGYTEIIGTQAAHTLSMSTTAAQYGIVGVGIKAP